MFRYHQLKQFMCKSLICGLALAVGWLSPLSVPAKAEKAEKAKETPALSSVSAVLYEPQSGRVLYEKDAHTPRPMASTTKIMTALLAVELCSMDRVITVSAEAVRVEGSALGLRGGDQITMRDLVVGLMLKSGNDAANVIAYTVAGGIDRFSQLMNQRAAEIGMKDSVFVTPSGLDQGDHSSSAYDMALLAAEALKNETLAEICGMETAVVSFGNPPQKHTLANHNKLLKLYPYAIGVKTGFTKKSGRCLVSASEKDGVRLIAVTLNAGDDWNDHIALYEYGFSRTRRVSMPVPDLPSVAVSGGTQKTVNVTLRETAAVTLLDDENARLRLRVELPAFVLAPVAQGEEIGCVEYWVDDRMVCSSPIVTTASVNARPVAGFFRRVFRYFWRMLSVWLG